MTTFVLVHGGWGGGWEWRTVARLLASHGHEAFTPTLTGLGERSHLGGPAVDLSTHVLDVSAVLEMEDLRDVALCGQSYGGMVIGPVADRLANRISHVIYIDAFVPRDGESTLDLVPPEFANRLRTLAAEQGGGWRVPLPFDVGTAESETSSELGRGYAERLTDQPLGTFTAPARLTGKADGLPHTYIRCIRHDEFDEAVFAPSLRRAREAGWRIRDVDSPHDAQIYAPQALVDLLEETVREP